LVKYFSSLCFQPVFPGDLPANFLQSRQYYQWEYFVKHFFDSFTKKAFVRIPSYIGIVS